MDYDLGTQIYIGSSTRPQKNSPSLALSFSHLISYKKKKKKNQLIYKLKHKNMRTKNTT